jgi:hypothetical protein
MVTPQDSPAPDESMPAADTADPAPESPTPEMAPDDGKVTIPLDDPSTPDAFKSAQPGDMFTVESNDGDNIVLMKGDQGGEQDKAGMTPDPDATGGGEENPAIVAVMAKKMKR